MLTTAGAQDIVNEVGVIGALGTVIVLLVGALIWLTKNTQNEVREAKSYAKKAEHAVNGIGPDEHRMYDRVAAIEEKVDKLIDVQHDFDTKGWGALPVDLATAPALVETIRAMQHRDGHIVEALERIEKRLIEHVEWEESEKYRDRRREH